MKNKFRHLILSLCTVFLLVAISPVSAQQSQSAETLFGLAETNFQQFFPNPQTTMIITPWTYRFYPSTGIYLGVNDDGNVYVLGGQFGSDINNPTLVGTLKGLIAQLTPSGGGDNTAACEVSDIPEGMNVSQNGNTVNITTDGCIMLPEDQNNFCETPMQSTATGISILSSNTVNTFETKGITIDAMGLPIDPVASIQDSFSSNSCTINAPAGQENFTVNSDICFDVTDQFSSFAAIPESGVTVTPPVTIAYVGTSTSQVVSNCFSTDAAVVNDAFTGEVWVRGANGSFVQTGF